MFIVIMYKNKINFLFFKTKEGVFKKFLAIISATIYYIGRVYQILKGVLYMNENLYMMWLARSLNLNIRKIYYLLEHFGSAYEIWNAEDNLLLSINGITNETINLLKNGKEEFPYWVDELNKYNLKYISINDRRYPALLRHIPDPPAGLYIKGRIFEKEELFISVIGARRCSEYGKNMAYKLSKDLAREGFVIVSGMARGIDSMSHLAALDAKGKTIAVLGFGHKHCYPSENRTLMEKIAQEGCLISEYPPDYEASKYFFPQRNRIIAGLSQCLIVVEAGKKSGTLITVDLALESGRTVMTLPANITSKTSEGTNELIKQGCPIITNIDDVFFELGVIRDKNKEVKEEKIIVGLDEEERKVYSIIENEPVPLDYITKTLKMSIQDIQYILTMLEVKGVVQKQPGERYMRIY